MTIGVILHDGDVWNYVDSSNVHQYIQTEIHCLRVLVEDERAADEHFSLSYIFGNVKYFRKLQILGSPEPRFREVYAKVVALWSRNNCLVHELVLQGSKQTRALDYISTLTLDDLTSIPPLHVLRLNAGNVGISSTSLASPETLEICLGHEIDAISLSLALGNHCNLKYLKITAPRGRLYHLPPVEEDTCALFLNNLSNSPHLKRLYMTIGSDFPSSILDFASSIPPGVEFLTVFWDRINDQSVYPYELSQLAVVAPQLHTLHIEFPEGYRIDMEAIYETLLPLFPAFTTKLKHFSVGPLNRPFKCKSLIQILNKLSDMTSLETLKLDVPLRLNAPCCEAILVLLQNNPRLHTFSYHALMGPKQFQKKMELGLKLNRIHFHDVLKRGRLPPALWPQVLAKRQPQQASIIYRLLQEKKDELLMYRT